MEPGREPDVAAQAPDGPLLPSVAASDAPLPTTRSLDDALALLAEIEGGALEVFERHGLPSKPGLYRRERASGEWRLLEDIPSPQARWREILERPPEAGFQYLSLADIGRTGKPGIREVQAAAATLDRSGDLRRLLQETHSEEDNPALLMFWSTVELMAVLFSGPGRKDSGRFAGRRAVEWQIWRAEAQRLWQAEPGLSLRAAAVLVVARLDLSESHHSVRRRLSGFQPATST